ncbi:hypothetical protein TWF694_007802 [Orbilia ellipsospora]|uniref:Rhodopsin domain-containing protein n=1 Tax=Orbilia ellipsospora TaxID=2528407 RepID=A0AAV9XKH5_9PEZI
MAPTPTATLGSDPTNSSDTIQPLFLSITFVLLGLATIFVMLRFGLDDWLIVIGLAFEWALAVMNYFMIKYGTGRHIATVTIEELIPTLRYWFAYQIIYPLVLLFIKLSILSFYRGISPQTWYRNTVYGVGFFAVAWSIAFILAYIFECPNPSTAWSLTFPKGCVNLPALYYSTASINIASDLIILLLPIPVLHQLQIDRRRKFALIAIFSVGGVAVTGSVARLWSLWKYQNTVDVSYDAIFILLFSHIEINLAMMCACAPALKPFFKSFATPFSSKVGDSHTKSSGPVPSSSNAKNGSAVHNAAREGHGSVGGGGGGNAITSNASAGNMSPSIARNRAIFETANANANTSDSSKPESLESRVVEITGGTPYYTPLLDPDSNSSFQNGNGANGSVAPTSMDTPSPNFQLDGSIGGYGGYIKIQSTPHFRAETTYSIPVNGHRPSKLAGEYTVTCSSTQSLAKNNDGGPDQEYFGFVHRPSVWRRQSVMSKRTAQSISESVSPDNQSDLGVKIEQEVRVDYELMTPEEQERWERKRSVLDAVDSLW